MILHRKPLDIAQALDVTEGPVAVRRILVGDQREHHIIHGHAVLDRGAHGVEVGGKSLHPIPTVGIQSVRIAIRPLSDTPCLLYRSGPLRLGSKPQCVPDGLRSMQIPMAAGDRIAHIDHPLQCGREPVGERAIA